MKNMLHCNNCERTLVYKNVLPRKYHINYIYICIHCEKFYKIFPHRDDNIIVIVANTYQHGYFQYKKGIYNDGWELRYRPI